MITRFSIVTLVIFFISTVFVIHPVSFSVRLPWLGRRRVPINLATAPILAIAVLWAAQCLGATQIRLGIVGIDDVKPYNILILFGSLAYMAITLDITGVLQAAAFWVSNKGGSNGWKLYFYFYVMLTVLSVLLGNDPVILSGTVFLMYYTRATGLEPMPWLISEFAAANTASMVLFVGNPTNVVVCEGFTIKNAAFTAYMILPFLACSVFCFLALGLQFRDKKYIPRQIQVTGHLNPRGVLRDPFGAWVGGVILGSCLVVIIILSFFSRIDVWVLCLPFAVLKLFFDFAWDHYRFSNGMFDKVPPSLEKEDEASRNPARSDPMLSELRRAMTMPTEEEEKPPVTSADANLTPPPQTPPPKPSASPASTAVSRDSENQKLFVKQRAYLNKVHARLSGHFPTFFTALPRLPFALIPFAFSQFILIEALSHQGWIEVFSRWLQIASGGKMHPTIWVVGVLGVILCNIAGTNIGATILLTKVIRAADLSPETTRAAGISLGVASNIGAVSFTFSASLAGLLWDTILRQKGIAIRQQTFALWNTVPILLMTGVGLAVVSAEFSVLYG